MRNKLLTIVFIFIGLFSFIATPVYADGEANTSGAANGACQPGVAPEIQSAAGCPGTTQPKLENVVQNIINVVLGLLGTVAVVFIIIGGINYMTSAGDTGKVQKAKSTILYAVIGLIICALAGVIVNFTINAIKGNTAQNNTSQGQP